MGTTIKNKYEVPAVKTSFRILHLLSSANFKESNLTEIARELSLTPTSCFRLLQQLKELSAVRYDENSKKYTLGPYLVVLGERARVALDYIDLVMPYLERLMEATGLTTVLVNRVGENRLTHVAKAEGEEFGFKVPIGRQYTFLQSSYGTCFLAYMDEDGRKNHLRLENMTYEERKRLDDEFERIRAQGFAVYVGEKQFAGIFGVAAPIFSQKGEVEMCIAFVGLVAQANEERLYKELGPKIKQTAAEITAEITKQIV